MIPKRTLQEEWLVNSKFSYQLVTYEHHIRNQASIYHYIILVATWLQRMLQRDFNIKSDVFSFGVLTLEILSGKRNFSGHQYKDFINILSYVS